MKFLHNKKILFLIGLILTLGMFAFILGGQPEKETATETLPKPRVTPFITNEFSIELTLLKRDFDFPNRLKVLRVATLIELSESEAKSIANKLEFLFEPLTANDYFDGQTYIWKSQSASLVVYSKPRKFIYSVNAQSGASNNKLSDESYISIAEGFLTSKNIISKDKLSFSFLNFIDVHEPEGFYPTRRENADLIQVNFSPVKSDIKLVTLDPNSSPISIWMQSDGTIVKAVVSEIGEVEKGTTSYELKDYDEVVASLKDAKVVSIDYGNTDITSGFEDTPLESVTINTVEIAYLYDSPRSQLLQPMYLLKGKGKFRETLEEVEVTLYLPAIKGQ